MNKSTLSILSLGIVIITLLSVACKKEGQLGMEILPDSDEIVFKYDTINVSAHTYLADSSTTAVSAFCQIGSIKDPFLGLANSGFLISVFNTDDDFEPENIAIIDSIIVSIPFSNQYNDTTEAGESITRTSIDTSYYGTLNNSFQFSIYELKQELRNDSVYYSNMNLDDWHDQAQPILQKQVIFDGDEETLKFSLPFSLMSKFKNSSATNFEDDESFKEFFKGFYFKCENQTSDGGAIFTLNSNSADAEMTIYYKTLSDTLSAAFEMAGASHLNIFNTDYTGTLFENSINDTTVQDTVSFVQGLDGLSTRVMISNNELTKLDNKVIYEARLEVKLQDTLYTQTDIYEPSRGLFLLKYSDDFFNKETLQEYTLSTGYSAKSRDKDLYSFTITEYLQNLTQGNNVNSGLFIDEAYPQNSPRRTILRSGNNSDPMQIVIKYSDIPELQK